MSETKMYSVLDKWTDLDKENIVDFTSVDGVVTQARLNGVPVGGGGGDFNTAAVAFINDSQNSEFVVTAPYIFNEQLLCNIYAEDMGDDFPYDLVLYKGSLAVSIPSDTHVKIQSVTGDITIQSTYSVIVTGAGTITLADA